MKPAINAINRRFLQEIMSNIKQLLPIGAQAFHHSACNEVAIAGGKIQRVLVLAQIIAGFRRILLQPVMPELANMSFQNCLA